jgi:hypothetical protein
MCDITLGTSKAYVNGAYDLFMFNLVAKSKTHLKTMACARAGSGKWQRPALHRSIDCPGAIGAVRRSWRQISRDDA